MLDIVLAQLGSFIRHALAALAGALILHGVITPDHADAITNLVGPLTQIISGLLMYVISQAVVWTKNLHLYNLKAYLGAYDEGSMGPQPVFNTARSITKWMALLISCLLPLACCLLSSCSSLQRSPFDDALGQMMVAGVLQSEHKQSIAQINAAQDQRVLEMERRLIVQIQQGRQEAAGKRQEAASPLPKLAPLKVVSEN